MTLQAFHGDAALKATLIDSVRDRWAARKLLPATILKFDTENQLYSLGGALADTQDIGEFVEKTGVPHELAMLCEALVGAGVEVAGQPGTPPTFTLEGADDTLAFGLQWLEAIKPGADLTKVVPSFIVQFLAYSLSPEFSLAPHIEPASRAVAERILAAWRLEQAGTPIDGKEWRAIRRQAQAAAAEISDPWGEPYRAFIEGLGWPVSGLGSEFVAMFRALATTWMAAIQQPFLDEEDQKIQVLMMVGWKRYAKALGDHPDDEEAAQGVLDAHPEEKAAMMTMGDPVIRARLRVGKARAVGAIAPVLRTQMEELLRLIRAA